MDIQKLFDAMSKAAPQTRSEYHLTLGKLSELLAAAPADMPVRADVGGGFGDEHSYRGYYADLAFEPSDEATTCGVMLESCQRAARDVYEGYKGGDYRYDDRTPLWLAHYGCCGRAIVGAEITDGALLLRTKDDA